jgi:putative ABC transport system permease protein
MEAHMDNELRFHLEKQTEQNIARGMSADEARYAALRQFGNVGVVKEECRDTWGVRFINELGQDLRYGLRQLRRNPGFTTAAVLTLALGIGANTAIFSAINTVLLRRLPYIESDRLVWITNYVPRQNNTGVFDSDYVAWSKQNNVFESMCGYVGWQLTLSGAGEAELVSVARVTAPFFSVLGIQPNIGRGFSADEDRPNGPHVAVLSYSLWQQRFHSDPSIVGKAVTLDGLPWTVVGVIPSGFEFPGNGPSPDLFTPFGPSDQPVSPGRIVMLMQNVIGRLKPGISIERATSDLTVINKRIQATYGGGFKGMMEGAQVRVIPLHDHLVGDVRPALLVMLGAVGFVLLIACANVANLELVMTLTRQREMALRRALGADRPRLVRQLLTESFLLAGLGGAVGVLFGSAGAALFRLVGPGTIPHLGSVRVDLPVLGFTAPVAIAMAVLFGMLPASAVSKINPNEAIKAGGTRSAGPHGQRALRNFLVVGELVLAFVLFIGAGLLIRSFLGLISIDPGFNPHRVLTVHLRLPLTRYENGTALRAFLRNLLDSVRALPGVSSDGAAMVAPLEGFAMSSAVEIEGRPVTLGEGLSAFVNVVSPAYFHTLEIPILRGRTFTERDSATGPRVAILNQSSAQLFFPGQDPIGKRIQLGDKGWMSIVGVVGDIRQSGLAKEPSREIFLPYAQSTVPSVSLVVRTGSEPLALVRSVRSQVEKLDKNLAIFDVATLDELRSEQFGSSRFHMVLFGVFAFLALVLAVVGIYGVTSYSVSQRTHEIGIRIALGAEKDDIRRMVIGQGLRLVMIGVAIGFAGALALTRFLASLLYGVKPTDPVTFLAVSLILIVVALVACYIPAHRASKVDPMVALRYE